ncbi:MAG: prolipoprotein diacylglyceryl transferase [Bacteroidetes bacterium]|jgi:prolipoprotein diacylglyceryl transferase|nr:prolipoprotein diacylglyceryl transferase [Bacteroidota bacterium]MDC3242443.1 prolipoprotein diacylglyceryl transferase [Flavobacteriaceae bacterium]MDC3268950.1 prolipoprotein diacylglyceryl transferase [Flavobacteriaceae bacterium]|tara:strand:- start:5184 stop:6029 length:846 start_codon:yes stop_codon:yes gene_type:complete
MHFLQIVWEPASEGLKLFGDFKIHYYSMMWMAAFILGWYLMKKIYIQEQQSEEKLDSLFIYSVLGILIGARLGHVIFYQPELFKQDFFSVFLPCRFNPEFEFTGFRGLASHGAAIGMIISMYLYNKKVLHKSVLWILDRVVIPVALGAIFVRVGNFFNSEMIGKPADESLPWAIIFKNYDNIPRHPGQLYEAFGYIFVFLTLWFLYWKGKKSKQTGFLFGLFLVLLMTVRLFVERFKIEQVVGRDDWILGLNTGQVLSIPFILIGLYFMFLYKTKKSSLDK